jgi:hypothetical protein
MPERFLVSEAGVDVFASPEQPKRITVLDGELKTIKVRDGCIDLLEPAFLVADRALVQVDSLQPFSVRPVAASKPRSEPAKPKAKKAPAKRKAPVRKAKAKK